MKDNKAQALKLLMLLKQTLQMENQPETYKNVTSILDISIDKIRNEKQTPEIQARVAYTKIMSQLVVEHIKLNKEETTILDRINKLAHSKGIWGEMNMLNTTNTWPSN